MDQKESSWDLKSGKVFQSKINLWSMSRNDWNFNSPQLKLNSAAVFHWSKPPLNLNRLKQPAAALNSALMEKRVKRREAILEDIAPSLPWIHQQHCHRRRRHQCINRIGDCADTKGSLDKGILSESWHDNFLVDLILCTEAKMAWPT